MAKCIATSYFPELSCQILVPDTLSPQKSGLG